MTLPEPSTRRTWLTRALYSCLATIVVALAASLVLWQRWKRSAPEFVPDGPPPAARGYDPERNCFDAASVLGRSMEVFETHGLSGNGDSWHGVLWHVLARRAELGPPIEQEVEMGFGVQRHVRYQSQHGWIGHSEEAGAATFCSSLPSLIHELRAEYQRALNDPSHLERLIEEVPPTYDWDD